MTKRLEEILPKKQKLNKSRFYTNIEISKIESRNKAISDCLKALQDAGVAMVPSNEIIAGFIDPMAGHTSLIAMAKAEAIRSFLLGKE